MECQNIIKNLKINKNKTIGEVVVIVEGESEEFKLLKHIFIDVLDYSYVSIKRNKIMRDKFKSKSNKNSTIIVANTCNSNIKSLMDDPNYQDKLYNLLINDYHRSLKNVPIYIIWDRDYDSNKNEIVLKAMNSFKSALDNDYDMNGLLLLSYPCVESYEISNFNKQTYKIKFKSSEEAKNLFKQNRYSLANINEKTLLNAVFNMHRSFLNLNISNYDTSNFYKINKKVLEFENECYNENKYCMALSLISIMLEDLGILEI